MDSETSRHVVSLELVSAAGAEEIGGPDGTEAVAAARSELVVALWTEMKVALYMSSACGAGGDQGGAEEEVEDSANPARHYEADQHPEARTHRSTRSILADVADHEDVERGEKSPGDVKVGSEA